MLSTILGIIISAIISSVLSIIFSEEIIKILRKALLKIGIIKDVDLSGVWEATFSYKGDKFVEIIKLNQNLGTVYGHIEPSETNYEDVKTIMKNKQLKLKGEINDNRYLTGFWYHPIQTYRYHGAFQMLISSDGNHINGQWIGFSYTSEKINNGNWKFKRLQ